MYILLSGIRSLGAGKQTLKNFYLKQISKKAGVKLVYTPKMPFLDPLPLYLQDKMCSDRSGNPQRFHKYLYLFKLAQPSEVIILLVVPHRETCSIFLSGYE